MNPVFFESRNDRLQSSRLRAAKGTISGSETAERANVPEPSPSDTGPEFPGLPGLEALPLFGRIAASGVSGALVLRLTDDAFMKGEERRQSALLLTGPLGEARDYEGFGAVFNKSDHLGLIAASAQGMGKNSLGWGCSIALPPGFHYLQPGDIVRYDGESGDLQVIYRQSSPFNHLFVTERCNSRCLMCSQPPRRVDDGYRVDDLLQAIPLMGKETQALGFTGGEITLLNEGFIDLLESVKQHLPRTHVQVLSNGRLFAYLPLAQRVAQVSLSSLILCVPLYSDIDSEHDFVVQAQGAFDQTIRGLLNLARVGVPIEIRVVIHAQTYQRLPQLAQFIARNLPFASHIALMGMEMTGFTRANLGALWIDPIDYQDQLAQAVDILDSANIRVSIFNHQLCLLPQDLWRFSRQSISDWKNIYLPPCQECAVRQKCGGFFASATLRHSDHIRPFSRNPLPEASEITSEALI